MVVELKLRSDIVGAVIVLCEIGTCHRVHVHPLVILEHVGSRLQHLIILVCVLTGNGVLLVDAHVRHLLVCQCEQVVVVALVLGVRHREVRRNLDTVADEVVETHTCGEAVELLLDDATCLMVETAGDTEGSLLTTTRYREIMVLAQTNLSDGILPVGIVVVLLILRECRVIVDFRNIGGHV